MTISHYRVVAALGSGGMGVVYRVPVRTGRAIAITPSTILLMAKAEMVRLLRDQASMSDRFISHLLARNIRIEEDLIDRLFDFVPPPSNEAAH